ncbi:MAG: PepSY-associated TM helix domain-containing protein [Pseudomonadota bacterium]
MKIPGELLRIHKSLHTWTGILSGLLLFVGFFGGALTMFKEPLDRWVSTASAEVLGEWPDGLDDRLLPEMLSLHPEVAGEFSLYPRPLEHVQAPIRWTDAGELGGSWWQAGRTADGALRVESAPVSPLGELVDLLHRTGGIPGYLGDEYLGVYLMGAAAVLYFLALVSGLVLVLPTLVKDFLALRPGRNRKRFWMDAHNVLGITSLPFHLVISVTVIVFAFHDQFYDALAHVVYGERPSFAPVTVVAEPYDPARMLPLSHLLKKIEQEAPGFAATELLFMRVNTPRPMVRVALEHPHALVRGPRTAYLLLHPYTGAVLDTSMLPGRESGWSTSVNLAFALHFGSYGGEPVRWMYFLLGIMGALLFYTGNLLWLESRHKKKRASDSAVLEPSPSVRFMAILTVGVSLGTVLGVGVALVAGKGLQGLGLEPYTLYVSVFYAVLIASVVWAAWRGAARAAVELLAACALAAFSMPLASLLSGWGASGLVMGQGDPALLLVDAVALSASCLLAWAALRTRQRLREAEPDRLWSLRAWR